MTLHGSSPDPRPLSAGPLVIGLDLGGTKIAGALVDASGGTGSVLSRPTPAAAGPDAVLDEAAALIGDLMDSRDAAGPGRIIGIGIGTAGVVDTSTGHIVSATSAMPGWAGTDLIGRLRSRLSPDDRDVLPLVVQNDVDAHATGEAWLGVAAGYESVLVIAVGTGVGAAIVIDGAVRRGAHHVAGEIGHLPTPGVDARRCSCGRPGHLEALGSGPALLRHFLDLGGAQECRSARDVVSRAAAGDRIARRAVHDSASAVGRATAAVVTVMDPELVVFGGSVALSGSLWWDAMEQSLRSELIEPLAGVQVAPARLGNAAAIAGAARLVWDRVEGRA